MSRKKRRKQKLTEDTWVTDEQKDTWETEVNRGDLGDTDKQKATWETGVNRGD